MNATAAALVDDGTWGGAFGGGLLGSWGVNNRTRLAVVLGEHCSHVGRGVFYGVTRVGDRDLTVTSAKPLDSLKLASTQSLRA